MKAALLFDDRTDLVSANKLGHARNWPISKPHSELAVTMAVILVVIGCQSRSCSQYVETKAVSWTQWLKGLINTANIL